MTDQTKQNIVEGLFRLGAPCIILAGILWMMREAAQGINATVLMPVVKSHTEFLEATRQTLDGIEKTQQQQAATMERIAEGQQEIKAVILTRQPETQIN